LSSAAETALERCWNGETVIAARPALARELAGRALDA
jgi:hypothetical protein